MLSVQVAGADRLDAIAGRLREVGNGGLQQELRRELRKPPKLLERAVKAEVPRMPAGYERSLEASLRFRTSLLSGAATGVRVTMHGRGGGGGDRDVRALDRGVLRHPVYGRRRRTTRGRVFNNPWVVQAVRPGFWSDPARRVMRQVQDGMVEAIDRVAAKLARG